MGILNSRKAKDTDIKQEDVISTETSVPEVTPEMPVAALVEEKLSEPVESIEPIVHPRKAVKRIIISTGETGLTALRVPFGFNTVWNEDKVVTQRVPARTRVELLIPDECDLTKWVNYYKQLAVLGVRVIKFGTFEEA